MKILKFRRAKEGDAIGGDVLTAEGAEQLNAYRMGVERGGKPSGGELLEEAIFGQIKTKNGVDAAEILKNKTELFAKLREQDKEIYPGRVPWTPVDIVKHLHDLAIKRGLKVI